MSATEKNESRVELKVCERCGGLWLRPAESRWIYCGPCKLKVAELPPVSLKPAGGEGRWTRKPRVPGERRKSRSAPLQQAAATPLALIPLTERVQ